MTQRFRIRRGLEIQGAELSDREALPLSGNVGVLGSDLPGVKPALKVEQGEALSAGDVLLEDRRNPRLRVTAPVAGVVSAINRGLYRSLTSIVIEREDRSHVSESDQPLDQPADVTSLHALLLQTGIWARIRQRPFGIVPVANSRPGRLFITAMDARFTGPGPRDEIQAEADAFCAGVSAMSHLPLEGTIICSRQQGDIPPIDVTRVRHACFVGPHPAGLPGTHIHALDDPTPSCPAFHIDAQAVVELGRKLLGRTGGQTRPVSVSGNGVTRPGVYRMITGTSLNELLLHAGVDSTASAIRIICGTPFEGRRIGANDGFLGVNDRSVTVVQEPGLAVSPRVSDFVDRTSLLGRLLRRGRLEMNTRMHGAMRCMLPAESIERVWPHRIPVLPLLRALLTEDDDTALELGALAFVEEDLALASWACPAKYNYGQALRSFLDRVARESA